MNCVVASQEFYQDGNGPENVGVYNLSKGVNRFCLSKPGNSSKILLEKRKRTIQSKLLVIQSVVASEVSAYKFFIFSVLVAKGIGLGPTESMLK